MDRGVKRGRSALEGQRWFTHLTHTHVLEHSVVKQKVTFSARKPESHEIYTLD